MKVSAQYAATHFNDIVSIAINGEEVEIAVSDKATLKLVVSNPPSPAKPTGRRILGAGKGLVKVPTDEEWYAMKKELEHDMLDGPFFPPHPDSAGT